jgi:hypothetical protein
MSGKWIKFFEAGLVLPLVLLVSQAAVSAANSGFHTVNNKVETSNGRTYIPEGISVYGGLESPDYDLNQQNDYAQIRAAARYWHANTIRLQVAESNMFSHLKKGEAYNHQFMSDLKNQVSYAHKLGMAVVINDQTEFTTRMPSPTTQTAKFWKLVAKQYKNQSSVIFDIFNEPRLTKSSFIFSQEPNRLIANITDDTHPKYKSESGKKLPTKTVWQIWQSGGTIEKVKYLGMQNIVNDIRSNGSNNLIWVEGSYGAHKLPPKQYLLRGNNLVYSIHHPNLNKPSSWNSIGQLAATKPVVEGEWAQYQSSWAECFSSAYTNAPRYLNYLHEHNVGVIAWSLQTNSLIKGNENIRPTNLNTPYDPKTAADLKTPDHLTTNYVCDTHQHGQGVGRLLYRYFSKYSTRYNFN